MAVLPRHVFPPGVVEVDPDCLPWNHRPLASLLHVLAVVAPPSGAGTHTQLKKKCIFHSFAKNGSLANYFLEPTKH